MLQDLKKNPLILKADQPVAVRECLGDNGRKRAVAEGQLRSLPQFSARAH
ncbi:hypothetical protein SDC9_116411 [bioreactor metagenome]|uniref:Uncharacterized protein n=1 Tax=bioreactor metagenome TaxID=1076179 RepID=A0A645BVE8_9ZZZZ